MTPFAAETAGADRFVFGRESDPDFEDGLDTLIIPGRLKFTDLDIKKVVMTP